MEQQRFEHTARLERQASFTPSTLDVEARTVELVWSTGARVLRQSWFDDPFYEALSLERSAVDLSRLNAGASLLNNHQAGRLEDVIGVVERAWVAGNEARALVRFSSRPEVDGIWRDVQDGILRNVSVGYSVQEWERSQSKGDEFATLTAVRWQPMELSLVGIPADAGAQVRDGSTDSIQTTPDLPMAKQPTAGIEPATDTKTSEADAQRQAVAAPPAPTPAETETAPAGPSQRERELELEVLALRNEAQIREACMEAKLDRETADAYVEKFKHDTTGAAFRGIMREALMMKSAEARHGGGAEMVVTRSEGDDLIRGLSDAIDYRAGVIGRPTELGRQYMGLSVLDMARTVLERRGINHAGLSKDGLFARAMHGTTDFPDLFTSTAERTLIAGYEAEEPTWRPLARKVNLPDFREKTEVEVNGQMLPSELRESGEYTFRTFSTGKGSWSISTYALGVTFTREMAINDDLSALTRIPEMIGRGFSLFESNQIWALLTGNALTMRDGVALFDASHNNTGSGAIDIASVGAGKKAMRKQTDPAGNRLNIQPSYMMVPTDIETTALQFLQGVYYPAKKTGADGPNPYQGFVELIVEPRLDDASATQWYLAANPGRIDMIQYGYLEGQEGVDITSEAKRNPDGLEILARFDFGAAVVNHRGFYRSTGA